MTAKGRLLMVPGGMNVGLPLPDHLLSSGSGSGWSRP